VSQTITCPACRQTLQLRSDIQMARFTCPRCLALVDNPTLLTVLPVEPSPGAGVPATSGPRCAGCGAPVEPGSPYCVSCRALLAKRPLPASADRDVGFDLGLVGAGLIGLAVLGAAGVVLYLLTTRLDDYSVGTFVGLLAVWSVLMVLPLVGFGLGLASKRPTRAAIAFLGGLITLLLALGLPAILILAVFVAFVNACSPPSRRTPPPAPAPGSGQWLPNKGLSGGWPL
jgi:hypothetical protein